MGRLSQDVEKPFKKTLTFKNEKFSKKTKKVEQECGWYFYTKSEVEGEKGFNTAVEMPFTFLWLTSLMSFSGFNEETQQSVYSNEVLSEKDLKELMPRKAEESVEEYTKKIKNAQIITAKLGKEEIAKGFYGDIKAVVGDKGGKFCNATYGLLVKEGGETEIVRLLITGGAVSPWINFANQTKLKTMGVSCDGYEDVEKGAISYQAPKFSYVPVSKELLKQADEAAETMNNYFRFLIGESTTVTEQKEELTTTEVGEGDNEFPWDKK
jgi:hypothetical protein